MYENSKVAFFFCKDDDLTTNEVYYILRAHVRYITRTCVTYVWIRFKVLGKKTKKQKTKFIRKKSRFFQCFSFCAHQSKNWRNRREIKQNKTESIRI